MKCYKCNGTGYYDIDNECPVCDGTGKYEPFDADVELDKLYPNTMKNKPLYFDKNYNSISLSYMDKSKEITLDYCCTDILYQLNGEEDKIP